jgi:hypothetical protein
MTKTLQLPLVAAAAIALTALTTAFLDADADGNPSGVPPGSIVGWLPPEEGATIPQGWLVCSRTNRTKFPWIPDLTSQGRFLRAAEHPHPASAEFDGGSTGGAVSHSHRTARRTVDQRRLERRSSGDRAATENHTHVTEEQMHLPPHLRVVFLCKCRTSDCSGG